MTIHQVLFSKSPNIVADGGSVSISNNYKIHTFTSSDVFSVYDTGNNLTDIEYLVVAGGGGGGGGAGAEGGAGGGAGGLLTGTFSAQIQNYTITVGSGGAFNTNGVDSTIVGIVTSTGGGAGGALDEQNQGAGTDGQNGGSGGGGGSNQKNILAAGTGIPGQGYDGSQSIANGQNVLPGAGGGAGGAGGAITDSIGGVGLTTDISGISTTYATGGDGGDITGNGADNTGDGGKYNSNGGSGIVIIRYQIV